MKKDEAKKDLTLILNPVEIQMRKTITQIEEIRIENQVHCDTITDLMVQANKKYKDLDAQLKETVKPLNDEIKAIRDEFKTPMDFCKQVETLGRTKINAYYDELRVIEAKRLAEEKKKAEDEALKQALALEAEKKKAEKYDDATRQAVVSTIEEKQNKIIENTAKQQFIPSFSNSKVSQRLRWAFDIVDLESVPREYLMLDEKKVNDAIRNGVRDIPGLKISQKTSIAIK